MPNDAEPVWSSWTSALSLTPNVRRSWAPVGQPPVLTHPFNWKKASMAAALCYGVRGGGAQLAFPRHRRQLRHRHPLAEVIDQAHKAIDRVRRTPHLTYSFLRHAGLPVA